MSWDLRRCGFIYAVALLVVAVVAQPHAAFGDQLFKLTPSDGAAVDQFGISVAISGEIALIGTLGDDDNGSNSGSAYLFSAAHTPSDGAVDLLDLNILSIDFTPHPPAAAIPEPATLVLLLGAGLLGLRRW